MQLAPVTKISSQYQNSDIQTLINQDYLLFTLNHDLAGRKLTFTQKNNTVVSILDNGVIGFNLVTQESAAQTAHKNIVLSCAIHGNETAPIEICNKLVGMLLNGELSTSHRVLFVFGNIPAMRIAQRFVDENLNRLFTREIATQNKVLNTFESTRAKSLMNIVDTFFSNSSGTRFHYDLHTAIRPSINEKFAVYPYLHGKAYDKQQLAYLSTCGVNTILLSQSPTTTFSYYSSYYHQVHAFTIELGKVRPFGQNDMRKFEQVEKQLIALISELSIHLPSVEQCPLQIYKVNQVILKQQDDFALHFADDIANFTGFKKGTLIASETGAQYVAQYDGEAIVFPNANVAIGQRAILTVIPSSFSAS